MSTIARRRGVSRMNTECLHFYERAYPRNFLLLSTTADTAKPTAKSLTGAIEAINLRAIGLLIRVLKVNMVPKECDRQVQRVLGKMFGPPLLTLSRKIKSGGDCLKVYPLDSIV